MPFVLMCGLPCSGKTTRTKQLIDFLRKQKGVNVSIISDDDFGVKRNIVYGGMHVNFDCELRCAAMSIIQYSSQVDDTMYRLLSISEFEVNHCFNLLE